MQKSRMALAVLAVIPLVFGGCVSKSEYLKTVESANALEVDNARLKRELGAAGQRNDQLTADRAELERLLTARSGELGRTITELRQRVSALESDLSEAQKAREEKVKELSSTYDQLVDKMKSEIAKGQVTISELKGRLTVNMVDAILFDSGRAEIKPEGLVVLGKVIEILKTVNDKAIRIEGHTDAVPISGTWSTA